jgi:hypothetical protein
VPIHARQYNTGCFIEPETLCPEPEKPQSGCHHNHYTQPKSQTQMAWAFSSVRLGGILGHVARA